MHVSERVLLALFWRQYPLASLRETFDDKVLAADSLGR